MIPTTDPVVTESGNNVEFATNAEHCGVPSSQATQADDSRDGGGSATQEAKAEDKHASFTNGNHPSAHSPRRNDQTQRFELEQAQQYLDEGNSDEAALICKEHIQRFPNSGQAYYLLGRCIELSGEQAVAVTLYRRAISLEPEHYQALVRLVALLEQKGDVVAASFFRDRAQRIIFSDPVKKIAPHS
jgi:chemotaxis protein methyltransferase WspC